MSVSKFGQRVSLSVLDKSGKLILNTEGLRVDFEIDATVDYHRAKFTIFNLAPDTIKQISNGYRVVKMSTQLHDYPVQEMRYDFVVNNAVTVKRVPDSATELYCIGTIKKDFTDKQVQIRVDNPKLKRYCDSLAKAAGVNITFRYTDFPPNILDYQPPSPQATWSGTVLGALKKLGTQYSFIINEEADNVLELIYQPLHQNQGQSGQNKRASYILRTENMRSNPRIGVAKLEVACNLDFNIKMGTMLDTSQLVSSEFLDPFNFATQVNKQAQAAVEGNSRFSAYTIKHKGSNYTSEWITTAGATKPSKGTKETRCKE